jgi:hypothetical protein
MAITNGQAFWRFDPTEDVVSDRQDISAGLWSSGAGTLLTAHTSSEQTASTGQYYIDIYNVATSSTTTTPEVQFSLAYGNKAGSGSLKLNEQYPTRAIYSQYKNVLLEPTDEYFTIDGVNKSHIVVVNFKLDRIKQTLDPGNWELAVSGSNGNTYKFIDDSGQTLSPTLGRAGRRFNIVSGTIAGGTYSPTTTFGLAYPDMGFLIFNPDAVSSSAAVVCNVSASNANNANHRVFWLAVSGAMSAGNGFIARNSENIASTHYFVRVKNAAFNFSNNPTFITGTLGDFYNQDMVRNPSVFITTVGMYNNNNELLATAKLSQPLKKAFNTEALIRVKLDF